ncbi:hypothetical protein [Methanobacterium sp.]|uniref:hypothetical protein n=1 Tax=Methanobacterium sp. TaxID=2164 RepID=UPI003C76E196
MVLNGNDSLESDLMPKIKVKDDLCDVCGTYMKVCPYDVLIQDTNGRIKSYRKIITWK